MASRPWRPSRAAVIFIGIITVWPILYFFIFVGFMFLMFFSFGTGSKTTPNWVFVIFPLHLLTMLMMFASAATYIVHAFRTDLIAEDRRVLWVIVLLFGGIIADPIYWYLYMWRPASQSPVTIDGTAG